MTENWKFGDVLKRRPGYEYPGQSWRSYRAIRRQRLMVINHCPGAKNIDGVAVGPGADSGVSNLWLTELWVLDD